MPADLEPVDRNDLRASHEDRDAIVERLRVAAGDGRIDAEELDQRLEAALSARTYGELAVIVRDLPESPEQSAKAVAHRAEVAEQQNITLTHGSTHKSGAWLVPRQLLITGRHANVLLDFTEAVFSGAREVELVLEVRHANIRLLLPEGSHLEESGLDRRHTHFTQHRLGPAGPESVRIVVTGRIEHCNIRARRISRRRQRIRARRAQRMLGR